MNAILTLAALGMLLAGSARASDGKMSLGWIEPVMLDPQLGLKLEAKLDTGADTSSLDAREIRRVKIGDKSYVRFSVRHPETKELVSLRKPYVRRVRIKRHSGDYQRRNVVRMQICVGDHTRSIEVNLIDRGNFEYPMLLGRSALQGWATVDPAQERTVEPTCWLSPGEVPNDEAPNPPDVVDLDGLDGGDEDKSGKASAASASPVQKTEQNPAATDQPGPIPGPAPSTAAIEPPTPAEPPAASDVSSGHKTQRNASGDTAIAAENQQDGPASIKPVVAEQDRELDKPDVPASDSPSAEPGAVEQATAVPVPVLAPVRSPAIDAEAVADSSPVDENAVSVVTDATAAVSDESPASLGGAAASPSNADGIQETGDQAVPTLPGIDASPRASATPEVASAPLQQAVPASDSAAGVPGGTVPESAPPTDSASAAAPAAVTENLPLIDAAAEVVSETVPANAPLTGAALESPPASMQPGAMSNEADAQAVNSRDSDAAPPTDAPPASVTNVAADSGPVNGAAKELVETTAQPVVAPLPGERVIADSESSLETPGDSEPVSLPGSTGDRADEAPTQPGKH